MKEKLLKSTRHVQLLEKNYQQAITLIALVVTIVVLLILAGVSIVVLWGDHGILKTAQDATGNFGIEVEREKIDNVRIDWWTKKVQEKNVTIEDFFKMLEPQIIENREQDVTGPDENNTYIVETKSGYTVEVILKEDENIQIGEITKGNLGPKIVSLKMLNTTATTITVKAEFLRAENATIKYEYKEESKNEYIDITQNEANGEVTISDLTEGTTYDIKVTIIKDGTKVEDKSIKVIARNITKVTKLILSKAQAMIGVNTTLNLTASIEPTNATIKELEWTSSNNAVAKVDSAGKITTQQEGTVVITAKTTDGSELEATCNITVIKADGSFSQEKGVNIPKLGNGMMAIIWDENANEGQGEWVIPNSVNDWYEYNETDKKWANAMTEDGSMWVWVPRYAYQIESGYHKSGEEISNETPERQAGKINIKFMKETSNISADGKNSWDNSKGEKNWNIHPGFEYDTTKAGLWVAKFEASSNGNTIQIKPNCKCYVNFPVSNVYTKCIEYNLELNSHLIKNTEWGAVAYLSQSKYGKNDKISVSKSFDSGAYHTGGGINDVYINKPNQSTTGNIYGIYDMSGGVDEYVAAYAYGAPNNALTRGNDYTKDVYKEDENHEFYEISNLYGDALYEISSYGYGGPYAWYGETALYYVNSSHQFVVRGGCGNAMSLVQGIFMSNLSKGTSDGNTGFRPVLTI